jgi:transcriptional regulator with XRE-family HTH domain
MRPSRHSVKQKARSLSQTSISSEQCRGARGMLGWGQAQLAEAASVSRMTIVDFEKGTRVPHANNLAAIRAALETAGVEFIEQNGGGAGVRLHKP